MALNTKRFLKLDPIVWPTFPPAQGLKGMPAHQAKEGALLLLEAGAPSHPVLVRMAFSVSHSPFRMEDAIELSQARTDAREKEKADALLKARKARGEIVVIEPIEKEADRSRERAANAAERLRIAGLKEFPVKPNHAIAASILKAMLAHDGPVRFTRFFRESNGILHRINAVTMTAAGLAERGILNRLSIGTRAEPSLWELTDLGRANAIALKGGSHAETA